VLYHQDLLSRCTPPTSTKPETQKHPHPSNNCVAYSSAPITPTAVASRRKRWNIPLSLQGNCTMKNIYKIIVAFLTKFLGDWTLVVEDYSEKGAEALLELSENVSEECPKGKARLVVLRAIRSEFNQLVADGNLEGTWHQWQQSAVSSIGYLQRTQEFKIPENVAIQVPKFSGDNPIIFQLDELGYLVGEELAPLEKKWLGRETTATEGETVVISTGNSKRVHGRNTLTLKSGTLEIPEREYWHSGNNEHVVLPILRVYNGKGGYEYYQLSAMADF
jgi:hypothetical protein